MEFLGIARTEFIHAPKTIVLETKKAEKTTLLEICKAAAPLCRLNPLLPNGHLHTIWSVFKSQASVLYYKRMVFHSDHHLYHGTFVVDFVAEPFDEVDVALPPKTIYYKDAELPEIESRDRRPVLIVLPGLTGGSDAVYLQDTVAAFAASGNWEICVINPRGCGGSRITSKFLYNPRATWDLRQLVRWLRTTFPNRPLFALGFSLGASFLTNYCAEEGSDCLLDGAVACSNPFNFDFSLTFLDKTWIGKQLYLRVLGAALRKLTRDNAAEISKGINLSTEDIERITYVKDFDRLVQCPMWGYPTTGSYYRDTSCCDAVLAIKVPFLAINASDDPIAIKEGIPFEEFQRNPSTVLLMTSIGGHLGWYESNGGCWYRKPIWNFLQRLAFDVVAASGSADHTSCRDEPLCNQFQPLRRKLASN